jgi:iron complex outermembrane receptor protein
VPNLYVRGIGTRSYDAGSEASVGTFVDGVYMARFATQIQDLADVERVEVLRGPQGALFGRNTIGGAINVVTRKPGDTLEADASVYYGRSEPFDGDEFSFSGLVGGPIVADRLSGQISYSRRDVDGAMRLEGTDEYANGGGSETARARLLVTPSDDLEIDLVADYFGSFDTTWIWKANDVGGARPGIFFAGPGVVAPINPNDYITEVSPGRGNTEREGWGLAGTINKSFDLAELTSITAYRESRNATNNDIDATVFDVISQPADEEGSQFSQELRLASNPGAAFTFGGRMSWLFGLYYFEETIDRTDAIELGPDSAVIFITGSPTENAGFVSDVETSSWAAFGQVSVDLTERLKLDVGLRYSEDEKSGHFTGFADTPGLLVLPYDIDISDSWSSVDPSASLSYRVNEDVMLFASYASGFKSGAFQFAASNAALASEVARPESLDAYQAGVRADWFGGRLRTNLNAFYYDYKDIQVPRVEFAGATPIVRLSNAAQSTLQGVELEGFLRVSDAVRLDYGYAFLDATYDEYPYAPGVDFSGNRLPRSPEHTLSLAVNVEHQTSWGVLNGRLSGYYVDEVYFEPDNGEIDPGTLEASRTTIDASIGLTRGPVTVTLMARNLGDEAYRTSVFNLSGYRLLETWAPRRSVGIQLSAKF